MSSVLLLCSARSHCSPQKLTCFWSLSRGPTVSDGATGYGGVSGDGLVRGMYEVLQCYGVRVPRIYSYLYLELFFPRGIISPQSYWSLPCDHATDRIFGKELLIM